MTILFEKIGKRTNSFWGDRYRSEYTFDIDDARTAKLVYADLGATLEIEGQIFLIKPIIKWISLTKFQITQNDQLIGFIMNQGWIKPPRIVIDNGGTFNFKKLKPLWTGLVPRTSKYAVELRNADKQIQYSFTLGNAFGKRIVEQYRESNGKIITTSDNLIVSLLGIFLVEQMLQEQN